METYLLTLLVTFEQEYAIQRLFTRHGWKYDKKENLADSHTDTTKPSAGAANASGPNGDNADLVDNRGSARIDIGEATVKVESGKSLNDKDDKLEYRIEEADHTVNDNYNDDTDDGGFGDTETLGADGDHDMDSVDVNQKQANCSQKHSDKIESSNINTSGTEDNITAARTPTTKRKRGNATPTKVIPTRKQAKVLPPAKASTSNAEKNDTFPDGITVKIEKDDEASFHLAELETIPGIEHYSKLVTFAAESDAPVAPPSDVDENGHSVALSAYFCSACGYTFPEEKLYLGHKRVGQCVFPCGFCGEVYSFRNYSKYEEHVKTHRSEEYHDEILTCDGDDEDSSGSLNLKLVEVVSLKDQFDATDENDISEKMEVESENAVPPVSSPITISPDPTVNIESTNPPEDQILHETHTKSHVSPFGITVTHSTRTVQRSAGASQNRPAGPEIVNNSVNSRVFKSFVLKPTAQPQLARGHAPIPGTFQQMGQHPIIIPQQVRPHSASTLGYRGPVPHMATSSPAQQVIRMPGAARIRPVIVGVPKQGIPMAFQTRPGINQMPGPSKQFIRVSVPQQVMSQAQVLQAMQVTRPGLLRMGQVRGQAVNAGSAPPNLQRMNRPLFKCPYCRAPTPLMQGDVQPHIKNQHPGFAVVFVQIN